MFDGRTENSWTSTRTTSATALGEALDGVGGLFDEVSAEVFAGVVGGVGWGCRSGPIGGAKSVGRGGPVERGAGLSVPSLAGGVGVPNGCKGTGAVVAVVERFAVAIVSTAAIDVDVVAAE